MFEKNLTVEFLLDFYGEVLPERTRGILAAYYGEDLSLAEIAQIVGISRQGVRDGIKKAEEELFFLEERLCLQKKAESLRKTAQRLLLAADEATARAIQEMLRAAELMEEEGV